MNAEAKRDILLAERLNAAYGSEPLKLVVAANG